FPRLVGTRVRSLCLRAVISRRVLVRVLINSFGARGLGGVEGLDVNRAAGGVDDLGGLDNGGERLAAPHLADKDPLLSGVDDLLREIVRGHAVAHGTADD